MVGPWWVWVLFVAGFAVLPGCAVATGTSGTVSDLDLRVKSVLDTLCV